MNPYILATQLCYFRRPRTSNPTPRVGIGGSPGKRPLVAEVSRSRPRRGHLRHFSLHLIGASFGGWRDVRRRKVACKPDCNGPQAGPVDAPESRTFPAELSGAEIGPCKGQVIRVDSRGFQRDSAASLAGSAPGFGWQLDALPATKQQDQACPKARLPGSNAHT